MSNNIKTALITGAAGGIGSALVKTFKKAGYRVIATDITDMPDDMECDLYVKGDLNRYVYDQDYASALNFEYAEIINGNLNVLINNAAVQVLGGIDRLSRDDWMVTININVIAPFLLTQAFLNSFKAGKSSVINIGSIHSRQTKSGFVAYATSKAALTGMTRALSVDLGSRLRVNSIEPAAIQTEMLIEGFKEFPDKYDELASYHPVKRIGNVEEVAKIALWLSSDECEFIHGACIRLDGGISNCLNDPSV